MWGGEGEGGRGGRGREGGGRGKGEGRGRGERGGERKGEGKGGGKESRIHFKRSSQRREDLQLHIVTRYIQGVLPKAMPHHKWCE